MDWGVHFASFVANNFHWSRLVEYGIWTFFDYFSNTHTHSFTHSHTHTYTRRAWLQKTHWDKLQLLHPSIASSEMNYDKITRRLLFIIINQTKLITFVNYWLIANLPYLIGFFEDIDVTYLVLLQQPPTTNNHQRYLPEHHS